MAARILGVANSAFFRSTVPVRSLSDAVMRILGLNLVRDLSLSLILSQPFDVCRCRGFEPMRYWRHAVMTAVLAEMLAAVTTLPGEHTPSDAYLGGLLHSLGLLALVHVDPDGMSQVFAQSASRPELALSDIECEWFGFDHTTAGADIAFAWGLPDQVAAAMTHHRDPNCRGRYWPLVALVALAERASQTRLAGDAFAPDVADPPELLDLLGITPEVWQRVVKGWEARLARIDGLAGVLAGAAP